MALIPGTRLGPYEVLSLLGAGGMGEVYRAKDTIPFGPSIRMRLFAGMCVRSPRRTG